MIACFPCFLKNIIADKRTYYVLGGVLLLVGFYLVLKKMFLRPPSDSLPEKVAGTRLTDEQQKTIRRFSLALYREFNDSSSWFDSDDTLLQDFLALNDLMFVGIYEDFNNLYFKESEATLAAWINNEFIAGDIDTKILERMNTLNLQ